MDRVKVDWRVLLGGRFGWQMGPEHRKTEGEVLKIFVNLVCGKEIRTRKYRSTGMVLALIAFTPMLLFLNVYHRNAKAFWIGMWETRFALLSQKGSQACVMDKCVRLLTLSASGIRESKQASRGLQEGNDVSAVVESELEFASDAVAETAAAGLDAGEVGGRECQYCDSSGLFEL